MRSAAGWLFHPIGEHPSFQLGRLLRFGPDEVDLVPLSHFLRFGLPSEKDEGDDGCLGLVYDEARGFGENEVNGQSLHFTLEQQSIYLVVLQGLSSARVDDRQLRLFLSRADQRGFEPGGIGIGDGAEGDADMRLRDPAAPTPAHEDYAGDKDDRSFPHRPGSPCIRIPGDHTSCVRRGQPEKPRLPREASFFHVDPRHSSADHAREFVGYRAYELAEKLGVHPVFPIDAEEQYVVAIVGLAARA